MNDKKKLAVVIAALVVIITASVAVYNSYKDRVDPMTGETVGTSQSLPKVLAERTDAEEPAVPAAPDFTMEDADGNKVALSDFKGTPVVLNFWTSWCGYCKEEMPYFESAYQQHGDQIQFIMLNIVKSERSSEDGRDYIEDSGYTFPVFYETAGKAMNLYGLRSFPATLFIDASGNIVAQNLGAISENKLNDHINTLLEEQ